MSQFINPTRYNASKIKSRRMPGAHRMGYAAYKTDAETVSELNANVKEYMEQNKKLLKEAEDAKGEVLRITKEHNDKVEAINKELTEKGATLKQIQDDVLQFKAKAGANIFSVGGNGAVNSFEGLVKSSIEKEHLNIAKTDDVNKHGWFTDPIGRQAKVKAAGTMTMAANVTGATISGVPTWSPEIAGRGHEDTHFRDIFPIFDSATGTYVFYRQNTPPGDGSITSQTTHGAAKSKKDYDLTLTTVTAEYLAGIADIARQMITDIPMLQSFVGDEMIEDYLETETFNMWQTLLSQSTGPTVTPGSNPIETMIKSIAAVRQSRNRANAIVARPALWAQLLLTKPADYNLPVGSVGIAPTGAVIVVGTPVYVTATNALSDTKFAIGDTRRAGIMQVSGEGLKMQTFQQHDQAVYNNIITMRVEARVALLQRRLESWSYQTA